MHPRKRRPPALVPEPEPHTVQDEEPHGREPQPSEAVAESLQEEVDRMEKLLRELKDWDERVQLVGDEDETASLRVQIANVKNLQLALPRPNIIG